MSIHININFCTVDKTARLSGCASSGDLKACLDEYNSGKPLQDQLCLPSNAIVKTFSMCGIVTCACHVSREMTPVYIVHFKLFSILINIMLF